MNCKKCRYFNVSLQKCPVHPGDCFPADAECQPQGDPYAQWTWADDVILGSGGYRYFGGR